MITMRTIRNVAFLVLLGLLVYRSGGAVLKAEWDPSFGACSGVTYFDYGAWLSGCGQYGSEDAAYYDLQTDCMSLCWFISPGTTEIFSGHWENDAWYVVDSAVCYC